VEQQTVDKDALNENFAGTVVSPGEEHWDQARAAWNLVADQNPAVVAYAESADDVAAAVNFARANGLGVAAQGTGHGAGSRGPLDGSILLKTERMKGIEIDADSRVGRYEAGVLWMEAIPPPASTALPTSRARHPTSVSSATRPAAASAGSRAATALPATKCGRSSW
jgi:hypothetical protein